jgi:hypothetical protein
MMIRILLLFGAAVLPLFAAAQCLSGDCSNGTGKYDFGYAVYEGAFKNGKPHGQGTMDYGGGEKYVGLFANGSEEGDGILYKGGTQKVVTYRGGQMMVRREAPVAIGANKVKYDGGMDCTGDCYDGQGTAKFPSGNVYSGGFKGGLFHGQGRMRFASGNVLDGEFVNHIPQQGTFTYAADGTVFTGTFNKDGTPATGTYKSRETGGVVTVNSGAITSVSNPRLDSIRAAQPKYSSKKCSFCKGAGFTTGTSTSSQQLTPNVYRSHSSGYADLVSAGQSVKHTHTTQTKCPMCGGSGEIQERQKGR